MASVTSREHREGEAARLGPARYLLPPHVPPPYGKGHRDSTARPFSPAQSGGGDGLGLDSSDPDRPALGPRLRPAGFASLRRAALQAGPLKLATACTECGGARRVDASAGPVQPASARGGIEDAKPVAAPDSTLKSPQPGPSTT